MTNWALNPGVVSKALSGEAVASEAQVSARSVWFRKPGQCSYTDMLAFSSLKPGLWPLMFCFRSVGVLEANWDFFYIRLFSLAAFNINTCRQCNVRETNIGHHRSHTNLPFPSCCHPVTRLHLVSRCLNSTFTVPPSIQSSSPPNPLRICCEYFVFSTSVSRLWSL